MASLSLSAAEGGCVLGLVVFRVGFVGFYKLFSCSCTTPRVWFCDKHEGLSYGVVWRCVAGLMPIALCAAV